MKDEDEEDKVFKAKQKADAAALKDAKDRGECSWWLYQVPVTNHRISYERYESFIGNTKSKLELNLFIRWSSWRCWNQKVSTLSKLS